MFDKLKAMTAMAGLLKNQDQIKGAIERVAQRLAQARVTGEAGGGAVRVTMSGKMDVVDVALAPALAAGLGDEPTRQRAEFMIAEAMTLAQTRARHLAREVINREAGALGLPALPDDLGGVL
ncbi:MAG: YbaB/EbfC family nucleoid-associated protein [Phycisphaerales bacterium]|nr:YbaB/EbfC family nucleoid-associated protein [Phycisphaerales bacterium]